MAETIWQLTRERAEATPDAELAVDELGRRLTFEAYRDQCEAAAHTPPPDRGHVRWLYDTSGTTGEPKGVRTPTARSDDRGSLVFLLAHIGGVIWVAAGLHAGCTHIVVESFGEDAIDVLA